MYQIMRENRSDSFRYRGSIIQGLMGPDVVILIDPLCNHRLRFIQLVKDFQVQHFMWSVTVEPFVVSVFPGTAWVDIDRLDMDLLVAIPAAV